MLEITTRKFRSEDHESIGECLLLIEQLPGYMVGSKHYSAEGDILADFAQKVI